MALLRHQPVPVEALRTAQARLAKRSAAEERNWIAREIRDVIAHSLTVSLLHISAARLAVETDPANASGAPAETERLARHSLLAQTPPARSFHPAHPDGLRSNRGPAREHLAEQSSETKAHWRVLGAVGIPKRKPSRLADPALKWRLSGPAALHLGLRSSLDSVSEASARGRAI
jgi:Histidine kinase